MHIVTDARMVKDRNFGIARYAYNLVKSLADIDSLNKYTVLVCNDALSMVVKADNFKFYRTPVKWKSIPEQWELPLLLKKIKPDIFHATSFVAPLLQPCKTIVTMHDLIHLIFPKDYGPQQKFYYRFIVQNALKSAARIIADSASTKNDLIRRLGVPENKVSVISLAAEEIFRPIVDEKALGVFRKEHHLPDKFILYVGNRKRHKNLAVLVRAFDLFKQKDQSGYKLIMTGQKDEGIDHGENIVFAGEIEDASLPLLYNAASLFVMPSLYEGFGLPALESMACGIPVISSNVSSLPEVVGDAGILVDPSDEKALAEAMRKVLSDPALARSMREKGLERSKEFSWTKCASETLALYQSAFRANAAPTGH